METLLEKAQRLGVKPAGTPKPESLLEKAQRLGIQPANVPKPQLSPYGKISNVLGEASEGFVKKGLNTLQNVGNIIAKPLGSALGVPKEQIGINPARLQLTNTAQKIGGGIETIAEFLAPSSKIAKAEALGTGLVKGATKLAGLARTGIRTGTEVIANTATTAAQQGGFDNNEVKTSAIISALFPSLGGLTALGANKASLAIEKALVKPIAKNLEEGFKPENVFKYKVGGSLNSTLTKTETAISQRAEKVNQIAKEIPYAVNLNKALNNTTDELLSGKGISKNFGDLGSIQNVLTKLSSEITDTAGKNGLAAFDEALTVKRAAGRKGAWTFGFADPDGKATEIVYSNFYKNLNIQMNEIAEKSGKAELKQLNKELSELIPIQHSIMRRIPILERQNTISLPDTIQLTASLFNPRALFLYGADKLVRSGNVANMLSKAADISKTSIGKRLIGK